MKRYQLLVVILTLMISQIAAAHRFGDAWEAGHSRIRERFYPGHREGDPLGLFLLSSTSVTTSSATTFTSGGDLMKTAELRLRFIDENLYALKLDSAKGQGEYLRTLAILSGCDQTGAQIRFESKIRTHFKRVFGSATEQDPVSIAEQIDQLVQSDPEMQKSCHAEALI